MPSAYLFMSFIQVLFTGFRQDLQKLTGLRIFSSQALAIRDAKGYTVKILGTDISLMPNKDAYFQIGYTSCLG
ncbi:hypothetical protein RDI58_003168 [Solanum bulbocastanum]|uniref:Uncharacterized protein n=1 Tax=Solanum bulbocastanum TaxID=147425 RepID=A0AAN8UCQ2_SOLBU